MVRREDDEQLRGEADEGDEKEGTRDPVELVSSVCGCSSGGAPYFAGETTHSKRRKERALGLA